MQPWTRCAELVIGNITVDLVLITAKSSKVPTRAM